MSLFFPPPLLRGVYNTLCTFFLFKFIFCFRLSPTFVYRTRLVHRPSALPTSRFPTPTPMRSRHVFFIIGLRNRLYSRKQHFTFFLFVPAIFMHSVGLPDVFCGLYRLYSRKHTHVYYAFRHFPPDNFGHICIIYIYRSKIHVSCPHFYASPHSSLPILGLHSKAWTFTEATFMSPDGVFAPYRPTFQE